MSHILAKTTCRGAREASSKILNGFACTNEAEASSKSSMAAMLVGHEPPS